MARTTIAPFLWTPPFFLSVGRGRRSAASTCQEARERSVGSARLCGAPARSLLLQQAGSCRFSQNRAGAGAVPSRVADSRVVFRWPETFSETTRVGWSKMSAWQAGDQSRASNSSARIFPAGNTTVADGLSVLCTHPPIHRGVQWCSRPESRSEASATDDSAGPGSLTSHAGTTRVRRGPWRRYRVPGPPRRTSAVSLRQMVTKRRVVPSQ